MLEPYGLVYHPKVLQRLGVPEPKDWDDLLHPKLKGNVAQCAPTRSSSSHATYEVILQRDGDDKGWEWLKRLGAQHRHLHRAQPRRALGGGEGRVRGRLRGAELHGVRGPPRRLRHQVRRAEDRLDHARADRHHRGRQASEGGARVHRVHAVRARAAGGDGAGRVPDHAEIPRAGRAGLHARKWRSSSPAACAPTSTST